MAAPTRDHLQRCFVLHRRDFGNTSLILEVFSTDHGRLPALAKGAKRGKAPLAALLQPFQPLWLSWSGRGEVHTLVRAEAAGRPLPLAGRALFCGFYLNELLVRLLGRGDPHPDLFAFYHAALSALATGTDLETPLRQFELRLLQELGYAPALDQEANGGGPILVDARYHCDPQLGPLRSTDAAPGIGVSGETLLRLASGDALAGATVREARELMRRLLAPHLGARPLKSRELFRRWYARAAPPAPIQDLGLPPRTKPDQGTDD